MSGRRDARGSRAPLVLTSAMAATLSALSGCSSSRSDGWDDNYVAASDTEICIDDQGFRIEDWQCEDRSRPHYRRNWYYVRQNSALPYYGDSVFDQRLAVNGSRQPAMGTFYARAPEGANMTRSAAVSRGGFGSRGGFFGSGRG